MRNTILLVKEDRSGRAVLRRLFEDNYNILETVNGEQAMFLLERMPECFAAVLLDPNVPVKDGNALLSELQEKGLLSQFPVLLLADEVSEEDLARGLELGASDLACLSESGFAIKSRVNNLVELYRHRGDLEELAEERVKAQRRANEVVVDALSSIIEYRSAQSGRHIPRIRRFTQVLLREVARSCPEYGLDDHTIQVIASAAALHEIGKISVPDYILNKPGKLTPEEYEIMKSHALVGSQMLEGLSGLGDDEYLRHAYNLCRYHHERWDGSGYPEGLVGDEIPIGAQAVGLADAYDALTTDRIYQAACSGEQAVNMILNGDCGAFSPKLLECFKQVQSEFALLTDGGSERTQSDGDNLRMYHRIRPTGLDTLQVAQMKYQVLLGYLNATAVEIDLDQGVYHLLYNTDPGFAVLRGATSFEEAMSALVREHIHPEDRALVQEELDGYLNQFFASGARRQSRCYRVRGGVADAYRMYEATLLRVDVNDLSSRKAIVVWRPAEEEASVVQREDAAVEELSLLPGTIQRFRADWWFTLEEVSRGLCNLTGCLEEEIRGRYSGRLIDLIWPEDRSAVREQMTRQLTRGREVELEFRLQRSNGNPRWVLAKGVRVSNPDGMDSIFAIFMDITQSKQVEEGLRLSLERHQIIMDQTNDIVFEWDCNTDQLVCSSKWEERFGYPFISQQASVRIPEASHFHPEDANILRERIGQIRRGAPYVEAELRIANSMGRYTWNRLRATAQRDSAGNALKVVGVIIDIDAEKRSTQDLMDKAERDALTRLLNKNTSRKQVEDHLAASSAREISAMLIVDLDNFKLVNDRHGHMLGDAVLTRVASVLLGLFRENDVVARIGGDEFMVFMKNVPNRKLVEERCEKLTRTFRELYREQLADCDLSCSVGVAFSPEHGAIFEDLFRRADLALYRAKGKGKDCYVCYDTKDGDGIPADFTVISKRIDSDERGGMGDDNLTRQVFHRLYESTDKERTIEEILAVVGVQTNVSRVYIMQKSEESGDVCCSFEWCGASVPSVQGSSLTATPPEAFHERGIFYCDDIQNLPQEHYSVQAARDAKAVLQCAIRKNGVFCGYIGFDDCGSKRLWTQEEIDLLSFLAEVLSVFLPRKQTCDV